MKKLKIGKSSIHGKGLFSGEPIKKGELIAKVHNGIQLDPETVKYMPTQYGRFYNHDDKGFNTRNELIGNHRYLRALKNIPANTELTANYREHPEMEQPEDFGKGKYASFDFDKTIATDEGLAQARKMIREGYNLFIISARDKVTPDMVARARKAGIPEENIIATGSDEAKVRKVKQLGVEMHFDDKPEVISQLGAVGVQFAKKGGSVNSKRYTRNLLGKNKLFVKNNLFKTRSPKNRIYDPNAKYFDNGGMVSTESDVECTDDGRCYETDQIQEMLDRGRDIPKEVLDNAWNVINKVYPEEGPGISAATAWKNLGVPTLASRLGMTNPSNCMWAAGSGWMCEPEFSSVPKTAFESNDKFINAVNKGTVPFERVTKTSDPAFDSKDKGLLQPGDIINIKGPNTSHAMTFSHYREDGMPIYVDSNGKAVDFDWNAGIWSGMKPGNGRTAYVSRFNPEMLFGDKIKELEEKARTNPTYYTTDDQTMAPTGYRTGGFPTDISIARLNQFNNGGNTENNLEVDNTTTTCDEGYVYDKETGTCVPLPDMKEWFTNWYKERTLPFDEIGIPKYTALMSKRLPQYNPKSLMQEDIDNLPDPEFVPMIANNPNVMGAIVPGPFGEAVGVQINSSLMGDAKELGATEAHEFSTYLDSPYSQKQFPLQNQIIEQGLVPFAERWGDLEGVDRDNAQEAYNYQTNPNEDNIHSLIFEERYKRNLKPNQKITEEDLNNWKAEAEASGALDRNSPNFDHTLYSLFKLAKDNKSLANWFNYLASNETPKNNDEPQYAKQGGSIGYELGDEVDEATMRKLIKLGYTFQKI